MQILKSNYNGYKILLFAGRLVDWKGVDYLIKSLQLISRAIPKIKLLILGDGPEKLKLEKLVYDLDLLYNVEFMGEIKSTDLKKYYTLADVFVIPSIVLNGYTEGLGMVTIKL